MGLRRKKVQRRKWKNRRDKGEKGEQRRRAKSKFRKKNANYTKNIKLFFLVLFFSALPHFFKWSSARTLKPPNPQLKQSGEGGREGTLIKLKLRSLGIASGSAGFCRLLLPSSWCRRSIQIEIEGHIPPTEQEQKHKHKHKQRWPVVGVGVGVLKTMIKQPRFWGLVICSLYATKGRRAVETCITEPTGGRRGILKKKRALLYCSVLWQTRTRKSSTKPIHPKSENFIRFSAIFYSNTPLRSVHTVWESSLGPPALNCLRSSIMLTNASRCISELVQTDSYPAQ
jgi:hypothetical protein